MICIKNNIACDQQKAAKSVASRRWNLANKAYFAKA